MSGRGTEPGVLTRSEEQLRVATHSVVVGRARLVKYVVTEDVTYTVPVSREEVRLEFDHLPEQDQVATATGLGEETYEVVRCEERVLITKQTVPVERVRMVKRVVTTDRVVTEHVRAERVDAEVLDAGDEPQ